MELVRVGDPQAFPPNQKGTPVSTPPDVARRFLTTVSSWLVSLPHDLRVLFEAKDEPNLDRGAREAAAGAIVFVLTPDPTGDADFVRFADDTILLRAVLQHVGKEGGEGAADFKTRFAEYYGSLDDDLAICKQTMGDTYDWITGKVATLGKQIYKGKKLPMYLDNDEASEELYEDSLAFATDYPIDENKLGMRLKKLDTLLDPLKRKAAEDRKKVS
jgi:hypothetical protein